MVGNQNPHIFLPPSTHPWCLSISPAGHEMSFAANYLGHFLLCNLLLEEFSFFGVREVNVTSS